MAPWTETTWKPSETPKLSPAPRCPTGQRVPAEVLTRILDHYRPAHDAKGRQTLARCLRVFKSHSDMIASRLYSFLDTRWMDREGIPNIFQVSVLNDTALFIEVGTRMNRPPEEIAKLRKLLERDPGPLPRPLDKYIRLCRWLAVTNVDEGVLHVICNKVTPLDVLHIPLTDWHMDYHRKAISGQEPGYDKIQPISRCLEYAADLQAHTLVVDAKPHQMAANVQPMIPTKSALYKNLKRLVVRTNPWNPILFESTPFALPFIKHAPPKDFEEVVVLHLPDDPKHPFTTEVFQHGYRPSMTIGEEGLAGYLSAQFHRRTHKKTCKFTIVGLEYASSYQEDGVDPQISNRVDTFFRAQVMKDVKARESVEEVKKRLAMWRLVSLEEYARELGAMEKEFLYPYVWDVLKNPVMPRRRAVASGSGGSKGKGSKGGAGSVGTAPLGAGESSGIGF